MDYVFKLRLGNQQINPPVGRASVPATAAVFDLVPKLQRGNAYFQPKLCLGPITP